MTDAMNEMRSRAGEIDERVARLGAEQSRSSDDIVRLQAQDLVFCGTGVNGSGGVWWRVMTVMPLASHSCVCDD